VYHALSAIFWLTVLIYWISDQKHALYSLQAFVLPPAAIFAVLPAFTVQNHYLPIADATLFMLHIGIAILAYSLFTFAALHALLMSIAQRSLHNKPTLIQLPSFPPLMVMETLLFRIITLGFILLTITLISGMLFSEQIFAKPIQLNHKTIFSGIFTMVGAVLKPSVGPWLALYCCYWRISAASSCWKSCSNTHKFNRANLIPESYSRKVMCGQPCSVA
jgi:ABC-type uncharacterized transport system permease subunit